MFRGARFKLTFWYVLIIMIISGMFSLAAYQYLSHEIDRGFRQRRIIARVPILLQLEVELIREVKERVIFELLITNGVILVTAGCLSYFLAGKTLAPIEKMMNEQKRFVSDASHELRTPLTSLKTEIEVSLRDKKMTLSQARAHLKSNLEEVDKMQSLTNYLLALNKYQGGQIDVPKKEVELDGVVNKALLKLKNNIEAKKIKIVKNLGAVKIRGNEVSLEELAVIFLDNAIKYSHQGGEIRISLRQTNQTIKLAFADKGIGIDESDLPFIMDRFYRADSSRTKEETDGYGIGLAIAKNIVEMHRGKIEVSSKLGAGSTFSVVFKKELIG